jgi:hypothetical protein
VQNLEEQIWKMCILHRSTYLHFLSKKFVELKHNRDVVAIRKFECPTFDITDETTIQCGAETLHQTSSDNIHFDLY